MLSGTAAALKSLEVTHHIVLQDRGKTYAAYVVRVQSYPNGLKPTDWRVSRRYREWEALHTLLSADRVYTVPALPAKKFFGNLDTSFLDRRQRELDAWLKNILEQYTCDPPPALVGVCMSGSHLLIHRARQVLPKRGPRTVAGAHCS